MNTFIEFKKQRDLGAIISDTFSFIRNEFKPFFKLILQVVLPYIIAMFASLAFLLYTVGDISNIAYDNSVFGGEETSLVLLFVSLFVIFISGLASYVLAHAITLYYIKSYVDNKGNVDTDYVKDKVKSNFFSFCGLGILNFIALFVAAILCFFPIIYMIVPMSVIYCLKVYQNKGSFEAFSDSFNFTWNDWGMTFLTLLVVGLLTF